MDKLNENMEKFRVGVEKGVAESYYRFLTIANIAVNKMARPITESAFDLIENNIQVEESKSQTGIESIKKSVKDSFKKGRELFVKPLDFLDGLIKTSEDEIAVKLKKEYGIDTNQWVFSRENLAMLEKINKLADMTFAEVQHISNYTSMRYLTAWTIIQKLHQKVHGVQAELLKAQAHAEEDGVSVTELQLIQKELMYYAIYAHATYGNVMNYVYSGKDVTKIVGFVNYTEEFLLYSKVKKEHLLHAFWDATPYRPAYAISHDEAKKSIILCMRGSNNWADFATDSDFHYLSISLMKNIETNQFFLKFNFNENDPFKDRIGESTKIFNNDNSQGHSLNETVVEIGYTHAGMFVSALEVYKEITPKLEEIFARPEYEGYNLVITGHSLGGGMSTLMTFLQVIHPLPVFKGKVREKIKGYSYGGACVLSKDFEIYLDGIMKCMVFGNDVVPRLSYGSIKDICKILLMFEKLEKDQPKLLPKILNLDVGEEFEHIKDEDVAQVKAELELYETFRSELINSIKLVPMGRTFFIEPFKGKIEKGTPKPYDFVMREIKEKEFFQEIIFSRELIKHHFPHMYEEGLLSEKVSYRID